MPPRLLLVLALGGVLAWQAPADAAITATIDTTAAKLVLAALQNPALSDAEALKVAALPGNQGVIRKLNEFRVPATTASFAHALVAAAHGVAVQDRVERSFYFDTVKPKTAQLQALLAQMEADPAAFQGVIERRINLYSPQAAIQLTGYVVAGGDGGGYAFGSTDFYLNIGIVDEFVVAKSVTTHELYHAVQGAFAHDREPVAGATHPAALACENMRKLFADIYEEGTAVEVADNALVDQARSELGLRIRADRDDQMKHIGTGVTLLEMTAAAFQAPVPPPFDDVYAVDFLGHGVLYGTSYLMARAITDNDGAQGLAAFLTRPPYAFVQRYTQLPLYGKDRLHPRLGPNTIAAIDSIAGGCR